MSQLTENAIKLLQEKQYFRENEKTWDDLCHRVASAIASAEENNDKKREVYNQVYTAMVNLDFLFSTPVLLNADETHNGQLSSCFVLSVKDNIESICQLDAQFAKIFQRNGGAGVNLSALRPAKSKVETSNGYAGGVISFMRKYDSTADEMTKNNPSRKGALKINLSVFHPQIYDFIACKDDTTQFQRMNISVSLSDEFMKAVEEDKEWNLRFPDYSWNKEIYNNEWNGEIEDWEAKGYPVKIYQTVKARDLFHTICEHAWKTGEPGINFSNTMKRDNKNPHISTIVETNPCSEFTNIPYSSCNLGSINLSNFVKEDKIFDIDRFKDVVYKAIRWFDNMITINNLPLKEIEEITKGIRPIGLGFMGLAHAMYKMGIKYNSQEGYNFAKTIVSIMREVAEQSSIDLAKERGVYPLWKGSIWEKEGKQIRNSSLLSIAPTGSISFIANTSGGCEPEFALAYTRRTYDGNLYYVVNTIFKKKLEELGIYSEELMQKIIDNHGSCQGIKEIPKDIQEIFVTAHDIKPEEHLKMLATIQEYVDLSCSKTINLPNTATIEDIENVYKNAWKQKIKGLTVYRDGSRENQTLSVAKKDENKKSNNVKFDSISPIEKEDLGETYGTNVKEKVACGNLYLSLFRDTSGNLSEVFINTSKGGICQSNINAISRLVSLALRSGIKVESICEQLTGIKCPACTILRSQGKNVGASCPDTIGQYLLEKYKQGNTMIIEKIQRKKKQVKNEKMKCPNCGEQMRMESGCMTCASCGMSKCG